MSDYELSLLEFGGFRKAPPAKGYSDISTNSILALQTSVPIGSMYLKHMKTYNAQVTLYLFKITYEALTQ